MVKNPPASARDGRDKGSTPGSGRSPGVGNGNHSSIHAWEIPWIEEPGGVGLQSTGSQSQTGLSNLARANTYTHTHTLKHQIESMRTDKDETIFTSNNTEFYIHTNFNFLLRKVCIL